MTALVVAALLMPRPNGVTGHASGDDAEAGGCGGAVEGDIDAEGAEGEVYSVQAPSGMNLNSQNRAGVDEDQYDVLQRALLAAEVIAADAGSDDASSEETGL